MIDSRLREVFGLCANERVLKRRTPVRRSGRVAWLHGGLLLQGAAGTGGIEGEGVC